MEEALYLKSMQHPSLRTLLLRTGLVDIVYAEDNTYWDDGPLGEGANEPSKALVRLREQESETSFRNAMLMSLYTNSRMSCLLYFCFQTNYSVIHFCFRIRFIIKMCISGPIGVYCQNARYVVLDADSDALAPLASWALTTLSTACRRTFSGILPQRSPSYLVGTLSIAIDLSSSRGVRPVMSSQCACVLRRASK